MKRAIAEAEEAYRQDIIKRYSPEFKMDGSMTARSFSDVLIQEVEAYAEGRTHTLDVTEELAEAKKLSDTLAAAEEAYLVVVEETIGTRVYTEEYLGEARVYHREAIYKSLIQRLKTELGKVHD